ncbi:hypothetical protein [Streptomyces sp. NBC_00091]|uniref:hypothetical protein n=1 Tax=Streptomyces sp. NBC_00091 TaxID=2975648 RepID=UPI002256939E|nr:hypothetical protein [Streptomyces sp. NBC_00091]MCX5378999.1 hypothetical protein [Streptomyces sp. NBC_00091]
MSTPPPGPFPQPPTREWQEKWVDAVLATKGVTAPRAALENIAPFVVRPKDSLTNPEDEPDGVRRLRPDRYRWVRTDAGRMMLATVNMHGVGGVVWEHNERISSEWHSVANPAQPHGSPAPSRVKPWARLTEDGSERTFTALESTAATRDALVGRVDRAANSLENHDGMRTYDLLEDLALNGQVEPCMYVAQHFGLSEEPPEQPDGRSRYPSSYWGWMAVRGNNRTKYRQALFEVSSSEVLTGVPFKKLGQDDTRISVNPSFWLAALSELLNQEYAAAEEAGNTDSRAHRAKAIASVESHLVIGSSAPERLFRIVQGSNRRDHVHPPLEFGPNDRGRALGRGVLGAYSAQGLLDDRTADVLAGLAPVAELPQLPADATTAELRDIRSMRLLTELFPVQSQTAKRAQIRSALGEPAASQLVGKDINRRVRAWSALTSESFPSPWNPRVAEVLSRAHGYKGVTLSGRRLPDLLASADTDREAFEELLLFRTPHWLASFDIIDADRGSIVGQREDDEGKEAQKVRRTVSNVLEAMRKNPVTAVGLLREIFAAMNEGDRRVRQIDAAGAPTSGTATRAWFNRTFTKESGTRAYTKRGPAGSNGSDPLATDADGAPGSGVLTPSGSAEAPDETPTQALRRLTQELERQVTTAAEIVTDLAENVKEVREAATAAGLDHAMESTEADQLASRVLRILRSLREIPETISDLGPM